jgi:hypothetical protein
VQDHDARRDRYARRHQIRLIDQILNEFELLNLAQASVVPGDLARRASGFIAAAGTQSLTLPSDRAIPIADWVTALFEVQDTLMAPVEGCPGR